MTRKLEETADGAAAPRLALRLGLPRKDAADRVARARVEEWTRERFALPETDAILVAEVACGLPGCPPIETVVAFWSDEGPRRQFKLFKPIAEIERNDLPPRWMKDALIFVEGEGCDCC
jgi:hypothetical protein